MSCPALPPAPRPSLPRTPASSSPPAHGHHQATGSSWTFPVSPQSLGTQLTFPIQPPNPTWSVPRVSVPGVCPTLPHVDSGARVCERCLFFRFQTNYGGTSGAQSSLPKAFEELPDRLRPGAWTVFSRSVSLHHPSCCLRGHGAGPSQDVLWVEREPSLTAKLRLSLAGETQPGPDLSGPRPPHTPLIPQGPSSAPTKGPRLRPARGSVLPAEPSLSPGRAPLCPRGPESGHWVPRPECHLWTPRPRPLP